MLFKSVLARMRHGKKTLTYPDGLASTLPERFCGRPIIRTTRCGSCDASCIEACPTAALALSEGRIRLDLGRCLFCRDCERDCPSEAIRFGRDHQLASTDRARLVVDGTTDGVPPPVLPAGRYRGFGRSCSIRVISAGGCGACEADTNVLNTLSWDLSRFGVHFVASPRHADGLLIIGPGTRNMRQAVELTYQAMPDPKFVIRVGACAISGGLYAGHPECATGGIPDADLYIPGCPPHPLTILDGILRFIGHPGHAGGRWVRSVRGPAPDLPTRADSR